MTRQASTRLSTVIRIAISFQNSSYSASARALVRLRSRRREGNRPVRHTGVPYPAMSTLDNPIFVVDSAAIPPVVIDATAAWARWQAVPLKRPSPHLLHDIITWVEFRVAANAENFIRVCAEHVELQRIVRVAARRAANRTIRLVWIVVRPALSARRLGNSSLLCHHRTSFSSGSPAFSRAQATQGSTRLFGSIYSSSQSGSVNPSVIRTSVTGCTFTISIPCPPMRPMPWQRRHVMTANDPGSRLQASSPRPPHRSHSSPHQSTRRHVTWLTKPRVNCASGSFFQAAYSCARSWASGP